MKPMRIGIYGGTFDPPHIGHLSAIKYGAEQLKIDRLIIIPAGIPPHKMLEATSSPKEDRLEMASIMSRYIDNAQVSDMELHREGKSYSVDTINEIKSRYPGDEICLFMGTDMLETFEEWRSFEKILEMCTLAVFARDAGDKERNIKNAQALREKYGGKIEIIDNEAVKISSTELRRMLGDRHGTEYITEDVYGYILHKGLYEVKANFDYLRNKAYEMLKPGRIRHVAGCEYEAVRLARRYGADEEMAREAAILHDITKKLTLEEQLILCEKYGIITDTAEKNDAKLLHSKTGAAVARDKFNISDEVYNAIYWHTTGKADMSLLEKIIYMADYIEPTRDFDGVDKLRKIAYINLDEALLLGLEMSLIDLEERNIVPHTKTQEAIDWLREQYKKGF